jgi:PAS domain S-box-containing protein
MGLPTPSFRQITAFVTGTLILQVGAFVLLGKSPVGTLFTDSLSILVNILAIAYSIAASRRCRGASRIFWLLFGSAFGLLLVGDIGWAYCRYFNVIIAADAAFPSLFYRFSIVPIAITLFLSDDIRSSKLETFLDSCIVVGLVGLVMYQLQMAELKALDPNMGRFITTAAVINISLVMAAIGRFSLYKSGELRGLFVRLAIYLSIYSCISLITSYVDAYFPRIADPFDLIWILTYIAAFLLAVTWRPSSPEEKHSELRISRRAALLCFNLSMAIIVLGSAALGFRIVDASRVVGLVAVGLVLFSYTIRCALMQDSQEKNLAALRESNTRFEYISLATNDVLWDRNLADECVVWNENVCSLFGYRPEDVGAGSNWWIDNVHPEDRVQMLSSVQAVLESEKDSWAGEYRFRRADGSYATVLERGYVVRDPNGKPVRLIGSIQDQTERKQAEFEIKQAYQAAESANRAKSDFLANMSHEIRTPMNGIIGMTDLLLDTNLNVEQADYLQMVKSSADSLLTIINDILDFSKIEAGRLELNCVNFDLRKTLGDLTKSMAVKIHQIGLEFIFDIDPDVPAAVDGDPVRIRQVLVNLIGNSLKFTERGEIQIAVQVEEQRGTGTILRFSVRDTGIGIPIDRQDKIFAAFSQADSSVSRKYGGTGLGLTISKQLVTLMGGRLWLESEVGKGSTFYFTIQVGCAVAGADPASLELSHLAGIPILIVDDNATNRRVLEDSVTKWKMIPTVVESAAEALQALDLRKSTGMKLPLILTDAHMPEMDGFGLVERIRQDPSLSALPIVMLTSAGELGDAARCRTLRVAAYLNKPFDRLELRGVLLRVLAQDSTIPGKIDLVSRPAMLEQEISLSFLVAEDNEVNRRLITRLLEKRGHRVVLARNGLEALEALEKQSFAFVLMDGQMPELDGFEATKQIREKEKLSGNHVPIIALTALAMQGDQERCLACGMDGYVSKPIKLEELFTVIEEVVPRIHRVSDTRVPAQRDEEPAGPKR